MNNVSSLVFAFSIISLCLFASLGVSEAATVFADDFSSSNFSNWSATLTSTASSQSITDGVARFIVPTPQGGNMTYSYVRKDGFFSTMKSTIIATQDVLVTKVPFGCPRENGAIFFFYVCDSTDFSGNKGNFGVGIDGSNAWSLWIGGNTVYTYVFQTVGPAPVSNTWYHIVLTIDNSAATAMLTVNGVVVISINQQQFTDATHAISLLTGMGEDWFSDGIGLQEVDIDNVELYISDAPLPTPSPTPYISSSSQASSADAITPTPTHTPSSQAKPQVTPIPSTTLSPRPSSTQMPLPTVEQSLPSWLALPVITAAVAGLAILIMLRRKGL